MLHSDQSFPSPLLPVSPSTPLSAISISPPPPLRKDLETGSYQVGVAGTLYANYAGLEISEIHPSLFP